MSPLLTTPIVKGTKEFKIIAKVWTGIFRQKMIYTLKLNVTALPPPFEIKRWKPYFVELSDQSMELDNEHNITGTDEFGIRQLIKFSIFLASNLNILRLYQIALN